MGAALMSSMGSSESVSMQQPAASDCRTEGYAASSEPSDAADVRTKLMNARCDDCRGITMCRIPYTTRCGDPLGEGIPCKFCGKATLRVDSAIRMGIDAAFWHAASS